MRVVTDTTADRIAAKVKAGDGRAWARVTIQPLMLQKWSGAGFDLPYETGDKNNTYTSMVFGQAHDMRELSNVKSIEITRSVDSDVQTCSIELVNVANIPIGTVITSDMLRQQESPGWFSFDRGSNANPWSHAQNEWYGWIVPDRIVRTYEGYGINPAVAADKDENMYPSGVWLIDTVTVTPDGSMRVECRDLARELLNQIAFIPVIPKDYYPMVWEKKHGKTTTRWVPQGLFHLSYQTDSNIPYIGLGLVDGTKPYVQNDGSVRGHAGHDAFDGSNSTYWMSVGNTSRSSSSAYEYVQGLTPGAVTVGGVHVKAWGGPYTVYISVKRGGVWQGKREIDYSPNFKDTNADIHYVTSGSIGKGATKTFRIPLKYRDGITAIRVTLHHLYDSNIGSYPYRGGLYDVRWTPEVVSEQTQDLTGNYSDYVDIVKTILAWGGFYWPRVSTGRSFLNSTDGTTTTIAQTREDPILAQGNIWGDFQPSGVGGVDETKLDHQLWDKKPLIDCITYIKDIIAYTFFIDETGAAVFRLPNIWQPGNYLSGTNGGPREGRTSAVIELDGDGELLQHSLQLSSLNRRDRVFVSNLNGKLAAVVHGYDPYPSATRRISGWTDIDLKTQEEITIMASLIAVRQALKMRSASVEIPGNPAIQIDDQIIVREEVTGTNHLFYITSLKNSYDAMTGRYTYGLSLQWLGTSDQMLTDSDALHAGTNSQVQAYIQAINFQEP
jgi:hypothetical protein